MLDFEYNTIDKKSGLGKIRNVEGGTTMKKLIVLLMALLLALSMSAPALAYTEGKNLEAPKATDVVIDGDLSEWDTSKVLTIDSENQIVDQIEHWDGVEDCSMELYAMWDEENLYVAMKITDDTPSQCSIWSTI